MMVVMEMARGRGRWRRSWNDLTMIESISSPGEVMIQEIDLVGSGRE
jgi:hypothetical protein